MAITLYGLSGSPYAWRVALALEHKRIDYVTRTMSYDAGDFKSAAFAALNPRRRVPVLVDDGFVLYESAAIVEYLEDAYPQAPRLFSADVRKRSIERRLVREADQYVAAALEALVEAILFTPAEKRSAEHIRAGWGSMRDELARWESIVTGAWLTNTLSAADMALFPMLALMKRLTTRTPEWVGNEPIGPMVEAWMQRMQALAIVQRTWPPHWK